MENYLTKEGFKKGMMDNNLYFKLKNDHYIIIVVYVDDIIFGSNKDELCKEFANTMQKNLKCL